MKKIILSLFLAAFSLLSYGQSSKVGTIDSDYVLSKMPEMTQAQDSLKVYRENLGAQLAEKAAKYETVLKAAQAEFDSLTAEQKQAKQAELAALENDVTTFRRNGAQLIEIKQDEVMRPLYQKIGETVAVIAEKLGYTQIINISNNNSIAYIDPDFDISEKVLVMMGISLKE